MATNSAGPSSIAKHRRTDYKSTRASSPSAQFLAQFITCMPRHLQSLEEQLNTDATAAATMALVEGVALFPFAIRVMVGGLKVMGSVRYAILHHWGSTVARRLFQNRNIVNRFDFNLVWWDGIELAFSLMFQVWVLKHVSHFCGTNRQLSRWDPALKNVCPSCGCRDESPGHRLLRCSGPRCDVGEIIEG